MFFKKILNNLKDDITKSILEFQNKYLNKFSYYVEYSINEQNKLIGELLNEQNQKIDKLINEQNQLSKQKPNLYSAFNQSTFNSGEAIFINNFKKLKTEKKYSDIHLLNNIKIPYKNFTRDIDHLLISTNGIVIIENKYWKGKTIVLNAKSSLGNIMYNPPQNDFDVLKNSHSQLFTITYKKQDYQEKSNFFVSYPFDSMLEKYALFTKSLYSNSIFYKNVSTVMYFVSNDADYYLEYDNYFNKINSAHIVEVNESVLNTIYFDNELDLILSNLSRKPKVMTNQQVDIIINFLKDYTNKSIL